MLHVARGQAHARERRAEQEEHGRHRDQHLPGMGHDHGGDAHPDASLAGRRHVRAASGNRQASTRGPEHRQERGQEREAIEHGEATTIVPQSPMDPRLPSLSE